VAETGAAEADTGARRRGRLRHALRLELHPRERVVRRAHATVAIRRRAALLRVHAGGQDGRRRGDEGGQEEEQLRGGSRAGASGQGPHGRWRVGDQRLGTGPWR
jgi:hypothetical protein